MEENHVTNEETTDQYVHQDMEDHVTTVAQAVR